MLNEELSFLQECLLTGNELKHTFNTKGFVQGKLEGYQTFMMYGFDKSQRFAQSVYVLCDNQLFDEVSLILRTFFEFYISTKLIEKNPELLNRYADYLYVMRKRKKDILKKYKLFEKSELAKEFSEGQIEKELRRVKKDYGFKGSEMYWFPYENSEKGPSFKHACRKVDEVELYDLVYQYLSGFAHADVMSFMNYNFVAKDGKVRLTRESSATESEVATTAYFHIYYCGLFNKAFDLGMTEKIKSLQKQHTELKKKLTWKV